MVKQACRDAAAALRWTSIPQALEATTFPNDKDQDNILSAGVESRSRLGRISLRNPSPPQTPLQSKKMTKRLFFFSKTRNCDSGTICFRQIKPPDAVPAQKKKGEYSRQRHQSYFDEAANPRGAQRAARDRRVLVNTRRLRGKDARETFNRHVLATPRGVGLAFRANKAVDREKITPRQCVGGFSFLVSRVPNEIRVQNRLGSFVYR